jgi:DNA-binding CsgD family transcriptional regulator
LDRQAFESALAGAREAAKLAARTESFDLYRRAVDHMPADLDPATRAEILDAFSEQAGSIEENEVSLQALRDAALEYHRAGLPLHAIRALSTAPTVQAREGAPASEMLATESALLAEVEALPDAPDADVRDAVLANITLMLGIFSTELGALEAAQAWFDRSHEHAVAAADADLEASVDWKSGVLEVIQGDVVVGMRRIAEMAVAAERAGYEMTGVSAYRDAAVYSARAMDYGGAEHWIGEGLRYADQIEQSHCAHVMAATSAMVAWADARWSDAAEQARQAVSDHGCRRAANVARWALGYVLLGRGVLKEATAELEAAFAFGVRSESIGLILPPMWGLAETAILRGEPDRAFELCQDALVRARSGGERLLLAPFVVTGVRAAQAAGRPAAAAAWYADIAKDLAPLATIADAALAHGRGLVLLADGATGIAKSSFEAAIRGWDAKQRVWEATWARLDLAYCLIRSNKFAEALALAVEARGTGSRLNSRSIADRADTLARMARGRVAADEPWRPLTAREYAVARLISEGMTNAEIADSLGIAPKTASSHVEHILAKLGASRRAEIATWASNVERSTNGVHGSNGVHGRSAAVH